MIWRVCRIGFVSGRQSRFEEKQRGMTIRQPHRIAFTVGHDSMPSHTAAL
jgi:hypothetical protein